MNKESLKNLISKINFADPNINLEAYIVCLDEFLTSIKISGEQGGLFKCILLTLSCTSGVKGEILKTLKGAKKNVDLSSALLVDVDTRYELLFSHSEWLIANRNLGSEFDLKLRSGARLGEEFFSDLIFKISKAQRSLSTELGVTNEKLKESNLPTLIQNLNIVNDYLSELLGNLPSRYDPLAASLLGV